MGLLKKFECEECGRTLLGERMSDMPKRGCIDGKHQWFEREEW